MCEFPVLGGMLYCVFNIAGYIIYEVSDYSEMYNVALSQ